MISGCARFFPVVLSFLGTAAASVGLSATVTPELEARIAALKSGETVPILINLHEKTDLGSFQGGRETAGAMIVALQETATRSQQRILAFLMRPGKSTTMKSFWISNTIAVEATPELAAGLAGFDEVETIEYDGPGGAPEVREAVTREQQTYWNMGMIRASEIWSTYALTGNGIVVGSMDTGVDISHPALAGKWRGGTNSWLDVINGMPDPYDDHGHGTHTIGTMVGGDGPGPFVEDIGLAYGAQFISAKVLDANNSFCCASIVITGAQWMLDPDGNAQTNDFPHVINNSWFFSSQTYSGFHAAVEAWRAAGIFSSFCIANFGPNPATTRPPGSYNNTLGIGAVTSADQIATFSSRGPSPAGAVFPADGRKPDLSAPGDLVRSSLPGGGYASWSGTSMASPHVVGTGALMLEIDPTLTDLEIRSALVASCVDRGVAGYDHDFGYGRLDAFEAVTLVLGTETVAGAGELVEVALGASPNPFSHEVVLDFREGEARIAGPISLSIFDVQGRKVRDYPASAVLGTVAWDGRDARGKPLPSGIYIVRANDGRATRKLVKLP